MIGMMLGRCGPTDPFLGYLGFEVVGEVEMPSKYLEFKAKTEPDLLHNSTPAFKERKGTELKVTLFQPLSTLSPSGTVFIIYSLM